MLRAIDAALLVACGCAAYALSVHAGRIGFMPLDQSIVFDGGWRFLNGQVPWRDFMTPNGLVPMAMQAVVFAVAGTSWSSYVAHAGLVNAAAAMATFAFLRSVGLGVMPGAACAVATSVWMYPLMGTPYMDQHSLVFAGVAVLACWHAAVDGRRRWWVAAGIAAALGILSKQIPALLILPLAGAALFLAPSRRTIAGLALTAVTAVTTVMMMLVVIVAAGARASDILEFGWLVPAELGKQRADAAVALFPEGIRAFRGVMPIGAWLALVLLGGNAATVLVKAVKLRGQIDEGARACLVWTLAGAGLVFATLLSCSLTDNAPPLLFGWLPLAMALMLLGFQRVIVQRGVVRAMTAAVAVVLLLDATTGYITWGLGRKAHEMTVTAAARAAPWSAPRLQAAGFSVWTVPAIYVSAARSLEDLLEWFDRTPGNFLIAGDESIVYGLAGRPSPSPLLWYHPGLTFRESEPARIRMDQRLDEALTKYSVRWVVVPENASGMGWDQTAFNGLAARLARSPCQRVGTYTICDILAR